MKKSRKRVRSAAEIVKELADLKERAPQGKRTYEEGERIQDLWDELEAVRAKENEPLTKLQELEDELIDLKSNRYWGGATEEIEARIRELEGMRIKELIRDGQNLVGIDLIFELMTKVREAWISGEISHRQDAVMALAVLHGAIDYLEKN